MPKRNADQLRNKTCKLMVREILSLKRLEDRRFDRVAEMGGADPIYGMCLPKRRGLRMLPSQAWHEILSGPYWVDGIEVREPVSQTNTCEETAPAFRGSNTVKSRR